MSNQTEIQLQASIFNEWWLQDEEYIEETTEQTAWRAFQKGYESYKNTDFTLTERLLTEGQISLIKTQLYIEGSHAQETGTYSIAKQALAYIVHLEQKLESK